MADTETKTAHADTSKASEMPDTNTCKHLLQTMLSSRSAEERLIRLYHQGQIQGGVFVGIGQEAIGAASTAVAAEQDILAPLIRNMAVHIGRGQTMLNIFRQWLTRANGPTRGRDGNVHHGCLERGVYGMISHLGAMISVATGAVMARRHQGVDSVGFAYIGDGGTSTGDFHEATNFAAVFDVPLVIIIENNRYAYSTPTRNQYRCDQLIDRAAGYGIEGISVDGNDVLALYDVFSKTVQAIRQQPRPVMIECHTMRMRGHGEHDDFSYIPADLLEEFKLKDPIERAKASFIEAGILSTEEITALAESCLSEIDDAYQQALKDPTPDPDTLMDGVYADE